MATSTRSQTAAASAPSRSGRATPLSPPQRRAAIIAATIPLLRTQGMAITTRQIAEAAGVAEGTIFSVFDDKESLIAAAVEAAIDPAPSVERLLAIEADLAFEARLVEAVRILQAHVAESWQLLVAVGPDGQPRRREGASNASAARHLAALEPLFSSEVPSLRTSAPDASQALLALTVGCSHPAVVERPMPPEQIVDLLLAGVRGIRR